MSMSTALITGAAGGIGCESLAHDLAQASSGRLLHANGSPLPW